MVLADALRFIHDLVKRPFYFLYERRLANHARTWQRPQHIGIVLDGNRRWARQSGLDRIIDGHARGADKLEEVLEWCFALGIPTVTVWVFSTDNFARDASEVEGLMKLFTERARSLVANPRIHAHQVRVRFIGQLELLPASVREALGQAEDATREYQRHSLNIAIAYGGRQEITDAFRNCIRDRTRNGKSLDTVLNELTPDDLQAYLYNPHVPDPDLIIRTSGEVRLSGFLLWQSAYAEYYFCDTFWPAFRRIDFLRAVRAYHTRQRRFGR